MRENKRIPQNIDIAYDVDIEKYNFSKLEEDHATNLNSLDDIPVLDLQELALVGILRNMENRSGTYLLHGQCALTTSKLIEGLEVLPIAEALEKYDWLRKKYWFKALNPDEDKYVKATSETIPRGFYIHAKKGCKIKQPFQAGLFMIEEEGVMALHNIVILEEEAELHLVTGCAKAHNLRKGLHIALTETYVGKNASLTNTMIHNWEPEYDVRPRGGTIVEEGGNYISTYASVKPPRSIQMDPYIHLKGDNSSTKIASIILGAPNTHCSIGATVLMEGKNTGAEIAAKAVCQGGYIAQTGLLIGQGENCRAHVDCAGLMMSDEGMIEATPALRALNPDARMSHEASIGRIAPGELVYLMSKGFTEERALSIIIRGFIDPGIEGITPELDATLADIAEISGHGEEWDVIPIRNR